MVEAPDEVQSPDAAAEASRVAPTPRLVRGVAWFLYYVPLAYLAPETSFRPWLQLWPRASQN
jgi:hypothetical protein